MLVARYVLHVTRYVADVAVTHSGGEDGSKLRCPLTRGIFAWVTALLDLFRSLSLIGKLLLPCFFCVFLWYAQLCMKKGNSQSDLYQVFLSLAKGATLVFLISPHPILTSRLPPIGRQIRRDEGKVPARYCLVRA